MSNLPSGWILEISDNTYTLTNPHKEKLTIRPNQNTYIWKFLREFLGALNDIPTNQKPSNTNND
jgi:hypothetical protein